MLTVATTMKNFAETRKAAENYADVFCSVGVHPHHVAEDGERITAGELAKYAADAKVVAFGESGLDYFYDHAPRELQQASFREHIRAAKTTGLPIIVHSRDAEDDTIGVLKDEGAGQGSGIAGVLHCFSSRRILAEEALELGFYISFSGIITFKKSEELREIARDVPLDRLLVETDSPFLAPEPYRGKTCEPAYVVKTSEILAKIKGVSAGEIAERTTENCLRLFGRIAPL